jgi:micrococcal nuclease
MLLLMLALGGIRYLAGPNRPPDQLLPAGQPLRVQRAVDGDTLLLAEGVRVRLIGVDTPETKHPERPAEPWGEAAAEFTQSRVAGREIVLEYDRERVDVYRRVLAYVYVDGRMLNEDLIRAGLSRAVTSFPYRGDLQRRFRAAERDAQQAGRGIWSTPPARTLETTATVTVAP